MEKQEREQFLGVIYSILLEYANDNTFGKMIHSYGY